MGADSVSCFSWNKSFFSKKNGVCVCVCLHAIAQIWRPDDNSLSTQWALGMDLMPSRSAASILTRWVISHTPCFAHFKKRSNTQVWIISLSVAPKKSCVPQESRTSTYNSLEELILFLVVCMWLCAGTCRGQNTVLGSPRVSHYMVVMGTELRSSVKQEPVFLTARLSCPAYSSVAEMYLVQ